MYQRILDASIRILRDEGALGFTTTKVAEEAGVGVGSLYQYFPNKQSIVVALHDENIDQGWVAANQILDHTRWTPRRKLTEITRWFFETEAIEAQTFGKAAGDLHLFLHADGARSRKPELVDAATRRAAEFIAASSATKRTPRRLESAADFLVSTVEALAKSIAARDLTQPAREKWADNTANMLADHLNIQP